MPTRILAACLLLCALVFGITPAHASRDNVRFGSDIVVPAGSTVHDAVCFFCSISAEGDIEGDTVAFFGSIHIAGHAQKDVVDFFGDVRLDENASVGHDLVNFFGDLRLGKNASVGRDMVAMFGSTHLASSVTVGGDQVEEPAGLFFIPLLLLAGIVLLMVYGIRALIHRRRYYTQYPFPPRP